MFISKTEKDHINAQLDKIRIDVTRMDDNCCTRDRNNECKIDMLNNMLIELLLRDCCDQLVMQPYAVIRLSPNPPETEFYICERIGTLFAYIRIKATDFTSMPIALWEVSVDSVEHVDDGHDILRVRGEYKHEEGVQPSRYCHLIYIDVNREATSRLDVFKKAYKL